jgi:hypothetical protein
MPMGVQQAAPVPATGSTVPLTGTVIVITPVAGR